jgi:hypothetical protein
MRLAYTSRPRCAKEESDGRVLLLAAQI